jgi:hypothetical protein
MIDFYTWTGLITLFLTIGFFLGIPDCSLECNGLCCLNSFVCMEGTDHCRTPKTGRSKICFPSNQLDLHIMNVGGVFNFVQIELPSNQIFLEIFWDFVS